MATMLDGFRRPAVIFDCEKRQHRKWAHQFMLNRNWSRCPVQFILPEGEGDVVTMIQRELARHYLQKEFGQLPLGDHERRYRTLVAEMQHIDVVGK